MEIHYLLLVIVYILCLIYRKKNANKEKKNKTILLLVYIILALFIGLRAVNIGTDTKRYVQWFLNKNYTFSNIEIMLPIIGRVIHIFTNKYFIYLTTLSFICIYGIFKVMKKYDFDTELFVFLYITSFSYIYSVSAIRFYCAFSIILYSFRYMIKKDDFRVILLVLIACLFHTTALIFIPAYYFTKFKYNKNNLIIFASLLFGMTILFEIFGQDILFRFNFISKYEYVTDMKNIIGGFSAIVNIGILLLGLIYYKNIGVYKEDYEFFIKMQLINIAIDFISIASRLIWYFKFPVWFIIPIILKNVKNNKKNAKRNYIIIYILSIIIYALFYYYYLKNSLPSHHLLDYKFNTKLN